MASPASSSVVTTYEFRIFMTLLDFALRANYLSTPTENGLPFSRIWKTSSSAGSVVLRFR